jgi:hypothetical protein
MVGPALVPVVVLLLLAVVVVDEFVPVECPVVAPVTRPPEPLLLEPEPLHAETQSAKQATPRSDLTFM